MSGAQTESYAPAAKAPEHHLAKSNESSVLARSSESASHHMLNEVHGAATTSANGRSELGGDKSTAQHLPDLTIDHGIHKPTAAEFSVPRDAQNHVTQKMDDRTIDSYKDKSGNRIDLVHDAKDPNKSFKLENHPDQTWKRTNGDGSTVEFNGTETISKDRHKTVADDGKGNVRTQFENGKATDHRSTPDGFYEMHTGPHAQDNFNVFQQGDVVTTSKTGKNGDVREKSINLKDAGKNFEQTTHPDGTYSKTYKNGTTETLDAKDNLTTIDAQHNKTINRENGDIDKENADGSKSHQTTDHDGNTREFGSGPKPGDNYNSIQYKNGDNYKHTDFGDGHTVSKYTSKDEAKNLTTEKFPDGSNIVTDRDGTLHTAKDGVRSYTTTDGKSLKPEEVDAYKAKERAALGNIHNDGNASEKYEKAIRNAVDGLPKDVQKLMVDNNIQVKMSDNMGKVWPAYKDTHPRNYPVDATMATKGTGAYDPVTNEIGMAERAFSGDPAGTIRHETGHAVDRKASGNGQISDSPEFKAAYDKDVSNMTDSQKQKLGYYLEPNGGRSEAFAELSADRFGGRPDQRDYGNRPLDEYMPETAKLVDKFYANHLKLDGD